MSSLPPLAGMPENAQNFNFLPNQSDAFSLVFWSQRNPALELFLRLHPIGLARFPPTEFEFWMVESAWSMDFIFSYFFTIDFILEVGSGVEGGETDAFSIGSSSLMQL